MNVAVVSVPLEVQETKSNRIQSVDFLRGLVMIIMALDHVRDYFHADAFLYNPLDLEKTSAFLFATRWITHFCAPVFVFLAGTSAFLVGSRKGKGALSSFLITRGVWLIVLEFTVINFAWFFNVHFSYFALTVIWALGIGMIVLAAVVHLPFKAMLGMGILFVAGHNLLDTIHFKESAATSLVWSVLHEPDVFQAGYFSVFVGYPVLPWIGVMILGYCLGKLYLPSFDKQQRKSFLIRTGMLMILLFVVLRLINIYGDPVRWSVHPSPALTLMSFFNVSKYPPSLLYVLITLGPAILLLAVTENLKNKIFDYATALGRVPMFYYIAHLFLIHVMALVAAIVCGYEVSDMVFNSWVTDSPQLKGYGFGIGPVYIIWLTVVLLLFPLCIAYDRYKFRHRDRWWLSYM